MYNTGTTAGLASASALPFTGLEVIPMILIGAALLGMGTAVKRILPSRQTV